MARDDLRHEQSLALGGGDPRPLWKVWDEFGIHEARMSGYWVTPARSKPAARTSWPRPT